MIHITARQLMLVSVVPNTAVAILLAWLWGVGKLHIPGVFLGVTWLGRSVLYLALVGILYFGLLALIGLALANLAYLWEVRASVLAWLQRTEISHRFKVYYFGVTAVAALLGLPYVQTRAHLFASLVQQAGAFGNILAAVVSIVSVFALLWNLSEVLAETNGSPE